MNRFRIAESPLTWKQICQYLRNCLRLLEDRLDTTTPRYMNRKSYCQLQQCSVFTVDNNATFRHTDCKLIDFTCEIHTEEHHILRVKLHCRVPQIKPFEIVHSCALDASKQGRFFKYLQSLLGYIDKIALQLSVAVSTICNKNTQITWNVKFTH